MVANSPSTQPSRNHLSGFTVPLPCFLSLCLAGTLEIPSGSHKGVKQMGRCQTDLLSDGSFLSEIGSALASREFFRPVFSQLESQLTDVQKAKLGRVVSVSTENHIRVASLTATLRSENLLSKSRIPKSVRHMAQCLFSCPRFGGNVTR